MKKNNYLNLRSTFIILFFLLSLSLRSQTILGYVYDQEKGTPLVGATVYLNGTTIGTLTDFDGKFIIATDRVIRASLIISYMGYETVPVNNPYRPEVIEVVLNPVVASLDQVTLNTGKEYWSREKMLREFKKQFLGLGRSGELCRIENEEDIDLWFQPENETLKASADVPIRIYNNYLGYAIEYDLKEFEAKYDSPQRENPYCRFVYYEGSSFYRDMGSSDAMKEIFRLQRNNAYDGSVQHFFRSMIADQLKEEGYSFYNGALKISPKRVYGLVDKQDHYLVYFKRNFILNHKKKLNSRVVISDHEAPIKVYYDGNYEPARRVRFDGDLGEYRIAKTLPLDYQGN
ncbi:carboxypeptidase-like regulatory domain-containing protein [Aureitalea marina]|uniref:Carboxypeptidase-like regulatory domain-containing protein n=1 Tax=Aureitalea marina TaxID=930804 RepID=A0A2S7KRL1_9FLAO|nr:carboxypeptidase-like regulatory domain-containing protein [Aureitalea marina]PQB05264.1 hypothetical protein BST85_10480 [Aureitalea marina]